MNPERRLRVLFLSRWLVASGGGGVQTYLATATRALEPYPVSLSFAALMPGEPAPFAPEPQHLGQPGRSKWCNALALRRFLRARLGDFDLVVIHGVTDWHFVIGAACCRQAGVPYLARPAGGLLAPALRRPWRRWVLARLYMRLFGRHGLNQCATVIASTDAERRAIHAIAPAAPVRILPAGTMLEIAPDASVARPGEGLRCVFLGRLDPIKALPVLFRALCILQDQGIAVELDIIGAGPADYQSELVNLVNGLKLTERVRFHGDLRGEAKQAVLRRAQVLVLPSYSENFGFAVAEGLALGLPAVVSDGVGLGELLMRYDAGSCFARGEPAALAGALVRYCEDNFRHRQMDNARRCAREELSVEAMGRALWELFTDLAR